MTSVGARGLQATPTAPQRPWLRVWGRLLYCAGLKDVDLFAGAGGLALGFEQAGFDFSAAVEYDPIHAATHKLNFPDTTVICDDVRNLSELPADELRSRLQIDDDLDAVIGGPPC